MELFAPSGGTTAIPPSPKESNLLIRPATVRRHPAVLQPLEDDVGVLLYLVVVREATRWTLQRYPFRIDAFVILPEHLHAIWTLPPDDTDFSIRWRMIKTRFVRSLPKTEPLTRTHVARGERGIWQRRFWEHLI